MLWCVRRWSGFSHGVFGGEKRDLCSWRFEVGSGFLIPIAHELQDLLLRHHLVGCFSLIFCPAKAVERQYVHVIVRLSFDWGQDLKLEVDSNKGLQFQRALVALPCLVPL